MTVECEFHGEQPVVEVAVYRGGSGDRLVLQECAACHAEATKELEEFLG